MLPGLALWFHHFHAQDCQPHDHKVVPLLKACLLTVANRAERWGLVSSKKAWFGCLILFIKEEKKKTSPRIPRTQSLTKGSGVAMIGLDQSLFMVTG